MKMDPRAGEANRNAKLREADIPVILGLAAEGVSRREIGRRFNVDGSTVTLIVNRRRWKHVARP